MSDPTEPAAPPAGPDDTRWQIRLDVRDALGLAGGLLVLAGAAAFHWGAVLFVLGAGMIAAAWWMARR